MKSEGIDAYFIPSTDPHRDEQTPDHWDRTAFISGFTGAYGNIVITRDKAMLWTDSRDDLQAKQQLSGSFFDYDVKNQTDDNISIEVDWTINQLSNNKSAVIGIDPQLISVNQATSLKKIFKKQPHISIKYIDNNLIDQIWNNRPPLPNSVVYFRDERYENVSAIQKIKHLQSILKEKKEDMHIVSNLESIARILNVRALDIDYTPLVISYLIVGKDQVFWFIDKDRVPDGYESKLPPRTTILPYNGFINTLKKISKGRVISIDPDEISVWTLNNIHPSAKIKKETSPIMMMKAIKNNFEMNNIKETHIRDSVNVVKMIYWLKNEIKRRDITEWEVSEKLLKLKKENPDFIEPSFFTVVSYMANGAMMHHEPNRNPAVYMKPVGIVLIDNGGQYLGGTTDMTRTITLGPVSKEIQDNYTAVLKAQINVAKEKFSRKTTEDDIDILARKFLWEKGLNYSHATGHGVGYCSCVHETTSVGINPVDKPYKEGMTLSIEPGYYKEGEYGLRVENIVAVVKDRGNLLSFMQLTMCPYERDLIVVDLLDEKEIDWINQYHQMVLKTLRPYKRQTITEVAGI